jgi:hypothetical protein
VYNNRLYIPDSTKLKNLIIDEFHRTPYVGHPGYQNMITTTRQFYYWLGMKKVIAEYIARFLECQQVKVEKNTQQDCCNQCKFQSGSGRSSPWTSSQELPRTPKQHDAIMVVVEKLRKEAHFIPIKSTYKDIDVVDAFIKEFFRLHGMPKTIILDWDAKFMLNFWKILFAGFGTQLAFNTTYHPQTDGQTKRVNRVLEDMLRMHVMHQPKQWEEYLPLVEFSYNNGYQESLKMSPFEALYGRK